MATVVDPYLDGDQYIEYDLVKEKFNLNGFYDEFRALKRCPPITTRRNLKKNEVINVDMLYHEIRARFKIKADNLYLFAYCLCALKGGDAYHRDVHELRMAGETPYLKGSVPLKADFRYPDLERYPRKFGYPIVRDSIIALANPPKSGHIGEFAKDKMVDFMLLIVEGSRNRLVGGGFHNLFLSFRVIQLGFNYTQLIKHWSKYSDRAREVSEGSKLGDEYDVSIDEFDIEVFNDLNLGGVAAEQYICMKNLLECDFEGEIFVFQRLPAVEPDDGHGPEGDATYRNPAQRGPGPGRGSRQDPGRHKACHKAGGSGGSGPPKGRKRDAAVLCLDYISDEKVQTPDRAYVYRPFKCFKSDQRKTRLGLIHKQVSYQILLVNAYGAYARKTNPENFRQLRMFGDMAQNLSDVSKEPRCHDSLFDEEKLRQFEKEDRNRVKVARLMINEMKQSSKDQLDIQNLENTMSVVQDLYKYLANVIAVAVMSSMKLWFKLNSLKGGVFAGVEWNSSYVAVLRQLESTVLQKYYYENQAYNSSHPLLRDKFNPKACGWAFGMNISDLDYPAQLNNLITTGGEGSQQII